MLGDGVSVRVRIAGDLAWLTIKGGSEGIRRAEFEYQIPEQDAHAMVSQLASGQVITKTRYWVPHEAHTWEVDCFSGSNEGLVLAELELPDEQTPFSNPPWVGREVSGDVRYYNAYLAQHPFSTWR